MPINPIAGPAEPLLRPKMPELDTLRGIAVLLVVCFHAFGFTYGVAGLSGIPKVLVALTMPGWAGVNLFFVLSGFLITGILLDTKDRPDYYRRFYFRRALRILPLYYATLLLLLIFVRARLVERHVSWAFLGLSAIYLANVTNLFGVAMQYGVLWSLAVEEHFYLLWPTIIRRASRRNVIVLATVIAAANLIFRMTYSALNNPMLGYTWIKSDGLAMGAILAAVARGSIAPRRSFEKFTLAVLGTSLFLFAAGAPYGIFLARAFLGRTLRDTALNLFFTAVLGLTLLIGTSQWKRLVNLRVLQFLGKISYGVYLIHMLIFEVVAHFTTRYWPELMAASGQFRFMVLQFCIAGSLTVAVACLSRWFFEEPFLRLKDRGIGGKSSLQEQIVTTEDAQLEPIAS